MNLKDKVVLITGASRGIGRATAIEFAKQGANVIVNYRSRVEEAQNVKSIVEGYGVKCLVKKADVSLEEEVKELVNESIETFGRIDILVNNAGIAIDLPFEERELKHWQETFATNLMGMFLCAKYVSPHMLERKTGVIINVSSTNALEQFSPFSMDYDASKAGVISLTRNLAKQFAPYIRVNAVAPGWVDTDMNAELPEDYVEDETKKIYLQRFAQAEEVAKPIVFLTSDDAGYINGSILTIDGGWHC